MTQPEPMSTQTAGQCPECGGAKFMAGFADAENPCPRCNGATDLSRPEPMSEEELRMFREQWKWMHCDDAPRRLLDEIDRLRARVAELEGKLALEKKQLAECEKTTRLATLREAAGMLCSFCDRNDPIEMNRYKAIQQLLGNPADLLGVVVKMKKDNEDMNAMLNKVRDALIPF